MLCCVLQYQVYVLKQNVPYYVIMALDSKTMFPPISKLKFMNTGTYRFKQSLFIVLCEVHDVYTFKAFHLGII